jgi:hypothetical protein
MSSIVEWDTGADRAGLFIGCFLRADNNTGTIGTEVCAPPLLLDDIATLFTPEGVEHGKSDIATEALSSDTCAPEHTSLHTALGVGKPGTGVKPWLCDGSQVAPHRSHHARHPPRGKDLEGERRVGRDEGGAARARCGVLGQRARAGRRRWPEPIRAHQSH